MTTELQGPRHRLLEPRAGGPSGLLALACALHVATACTHDAPAGAPPGENQPSSAYSSLSVSRGGKLYEEHCAECHGLDGISTDGNPAAPNLAGQGLLTVADDEFLFENIARPRPGADSEGRDVASSQAFAVENGGPLTEDQIRDVIAYLRQWQTEPSVELEPYTAHGDPRAGAPIYNVCAPCHGADGWSSRAPSLAGETLQDTASDAFFRHTILYGRPGCEMAGFDLDDREIADLIAHIRSLRTARRQAGPD